MSQPELLPCPFCGSTFVSLGIFTVDNGLGGGDTRKNPVGIKGRKVECLQCKALITCVGLEEEARRSVIERWNTRRTPEERAAVKQSPAGAEKRRQVEIQARREGMRKRQPVKPKPDS